MERWNIYIWIGTVRMVVREKTFLCDEIKEMDKVEGDVKDGERNGRHVAMS